MINKRRLRSYIKVFGVFLLFGMLVVVYITFMTAYLNEAKSIRIVINHFHEADLEAVGLPVLIVLGVATIIFTVKDEGKILFNENGKRI